MSGARSSASGWASTGSSASSTFATPLTFAAASAAGRQLAPATSTWRSPPSAWAAATALRVAGLRLALSCSARTRTAISDHPCFRAELLDELLDRRHLLAALALGGLLDLERGEPRRGVDAQRLRRQLLDRLLLRLHDVGERGIARLVEP